MSKNFLSAPVDPRLQVKAKIENLHAIFGNLKQALAMELAKPEPDEAVCYSLQKAILEMTIFCPALKEEDV